MAPPISHQIIIDHQGRPVRGEYYVKNRTITVTGPTGHSKTTESSVLSNDVLAKLILHEIVREHGR